jgi:NADPH-dependent 2,4-dienoyl-CoA reductase/sulfur reductase-like enzyme
VTHPYQGYPAGPPLPVVAGPAYAPATGPAQLPPHNAPHGQGHPASLPVPYAAQNATGVDAKRLPEAPVFSERVRTVRTLRDAVAVQRAMHAAQAHHVVILGGGFVGCELACTAREHGMDVTLVAHSAPLLRRVLGERVGSVVAGIQRRAGVDLRLGTQITD